MFMNLRLVDCKYELKAEFANKASFGQFGPVFRKKGETPDSLEVVTIRFDQM